LSLHPSLSCLFRLKDLHFVLIDVDETSKMKNSKFVPGPGRYNSTHSPDRYSASPRYGIGTSIRIDAPSTAKKNPGPGDYNVGGEAGANGPKFVIGTKLLNVGCSMTGESRSPGPGSYTPKIPNMVSSAYSMGLRSKAHSSINLKPDGSHQKMSLSMLNTSTNPGPGTYQVKHIYRK